MPYVHCSQCHHEWETSDCQSRCDWCGAPAGKILEKRTPLEKYIQDELTGTSGAHGGFLKILGIY
jgi:hypothetical protein